MKMNLAEESRLFPSSDFSDIHLIRLDMISQGLHSGLIMPAIKIQHYNFKALSVAWEISDIAASELQRVSSFIASDFAKETGRKSVHLSRFELSRINF
jgi:hypothetical protein